MSTDTMAWFDVVAPLEPAALRDRLAGDPALSALIPRFDRLVTGGVELRVEQLDRRPGGLALRLEGRIASAYHLLRFSAFASGGDDHVLVRRAFHAIASAPGVRRAVITHELAATSGGEGLVGVIEALARNAGVAATTYAELADADYDGPRSWIIDTFDDLSD